MKTVVTETEANRVALDAVQLALQKLPYDAQDDNDRGLAEHFLLKGIAKIVNSRLDKIEEPIKDQFRAGAKGVLLTDHYRRELTLGEGRSLFDIDTFIMHLCEEYPNLLKHKLVALASGSKKQSKPSVKIEVEYVGDVVKKSS